MKKKRINPNKFLQAYIIGLALGDGNLSDPNGRGIRLRISCDTKYPKLIEKIERSLKELLPDNKVSLIRTKAKCVNVSCYSNAWPEILGWESLGSKHKQLVSVPDWVREDKAYSIDCLRGLMETDGSVYSDRGYKMVMFVTIIEPLAECVMEMIINLGFEPRMYSYQPKSKFNSQKIFHIRISKNVNQFIELIKIEKS